MYNQGGGRPPLVHQRYLTHNTSQNIPHNIPHNINFNPAMKLPAGKAHYSPCMGHTIPNTMPDNVLNGVHLPFANEEFVDQNQCLRTDLEPAARVGCKRRMEQDDSLTDMEWLTGVNPMKNMISTDLDVKKEAARKRNRTTKDYNSLFPKPPFSYAVLILQAIMSTDERRMQLFQIYSWIEGNYDYYKHTPGTHWKSSIRHNLSLHEEFIKESPPPSLKSKGSFWAVDRNMSEETLMASLQPKRPRLPRSSDCRIERKMIQNPNLYQPSRPASRQPAPIKLQHPRPQLPLPSQNRAPPQVRFPKLPITRPPPPPPTYQTPSEIRRRPNILSKVAKKENKENSPCLKPGLDALVMTSSSTPSMNLNQLYHSNTSEMLRELSTESYESGYQSLNESQTSPPIKKNFVCSTPNKKQMLLKAWNISSPEFNTSLKVNPGEPNTISPLTTKLGDVSTLIKEFKDTNWGCLSQYLGPNGISQEFLDSVNEGDINNVANNVKEEMLSDSEVVIEDEFHLKDADKIFEDKLSDLKSTDKSDLADLINQFINEGEVCLLNGTLSTTPLRQYLNEEESCMDDSLLESPQSSKKKLSRKSLSMD